VSAPAVEHLRRLVARPTVAGGDNDELVFEVADALERAGADVRLVAGPRPRARNLHAVLGPADERGVLLAAHTDVVAVDGQPWTSDPFALAERDGRLYGRGTADMKGFVAAAIAAIEHRGPGELRRPLHLALSCDEELGCRGVPPLLDVLEELPAPPSVVVVGEPTGMNVATRHKGKAAWRVRFAGRAAHSSLATQGINAVAYAARFCVAALRLQDELAGEAADAAFSVPHATVSLGPIHGGVAVNIVPDRCAVDVEVRHLPGQDADAVASRLHAVVAALDDELRALDPAAGAAIESLSSYPALSAADAPTAADVAALAGGTDIIAVDFGTEAGLYQQRLGVPVVVCGPGSMDQGHQADEFLELPQLLAAERFVMRILGGLRAPGTRPTDGDALDPLL
jgi:acetylornithine deacetylase